MIASRRFVGCSTFKGPARLSPRRVLVTLTTFATTLVATLAFASAPALAKLIHKYEPPPIAEYQPGAPLGSVKSTTVDGGHLLVGEQGRIGEFDASSGAFQAELTPGSLGLPGFGGEAGAVAVGHSTGETELYVGVGSNGSGQTVAAINIGACGTLACATLQKEWKGEDTPNGSFVQENGEGQGRLESIAVDESSVVTAPGDWARGDVFVSTESINSEHQNLEVVDVFKPKAGGGEEYLTQLKGTPVEGEPATGEGEPFKGPSSVAVSEVSGDLLVVVQGAVDMFEPTESILGVKEYAFVRKLTGPSSEVSFGEVRAVAVAGAVSGDGGTGAGDIFVAASVNGAEGVYEFSPNGEELVARLTGTSSEAFHRLTSVAVDPVSGRVFATDFNNETGDDSIDLFSPALVIPDTVTEATSDANVSYESGPHAWGLRVSGTVNPDDAGPATCRFAWGTTPALGNTAPCEGEGESAGKPVPSGPTPAGVHTTLADLTPGTTYYYRLEASNANGTNEGEESGDVGFTTPGSAIENESAAEVASSSASLQATVAPLGFTSTYYFEFDTAPYTPGEAPHGAKTPVTGVGLNATPVQVDGHIQGLSQRTAYHYRVAVVSEVELAAGKREAFLFYGPDRSFTTQQPSSGSLLLDDRAWELVSPPNKHGAQIFGLVKPEPGTIQAAADGSGIAYVASVPTESDPAGYATSEQVLSRHGSGSWSSGDISPRHDSAATRPSEFGYELFSKDLSAGLLVPEGLDGTLLSTEASEQTPYLRQGASCEGPSSAAECFLPVLSGKEGFADVPPGTVFGENNQGHVVVGASPDSKHMVLRTSKQLTTIDTEGHKELYEWSAEKQASRRLELVSVLPKGEGGGPSTARQIDLGNEPAEMASSGVRPVSSDGSRVFWTTRNNALHGAGEEDKLYMWDAVRGEAVRLDVPQENAEGGQPEALFQAASSDGSRVFFTDNARLTTNASKGGSDLYECRIVEESSELKCALTDLTPEGASGPSEVQNLILGTSLDGSYVYFVASGVLGSPAPAGVRQGSCRWEEHAVVPCNLYVSHDGETNFIATLSSEDELDWGGENRIFHTVGEQVARVSGNGRFVVFMSSSSLTGYDNRDVKSHKPDQEVYEYDAQTERLTCVSCSPTGAQPTGVEVGTTDGKFSAAAIAGGVGFRYGSSSWVAANLPAAVAVGPYQMASYLPRNLSDSGRVFFNSSDALVPLDVNGQEDVYEFEPVGVGTCTEGSSGYIASEDGCVGLISSGTASEESGFLDASENGDDVFFLTAEKLAREDYDTSYDVYDAHVCGSGWSCVSPASPAPPCSTADACRAAPAPQPGIFGSPPSATFSGAGNLTAPAPSKKVTKKTVKCKRGFVKNKKGRCIKKKSKKRAKRASRNRRTRS